MPQIEVPREWQVPDAKMPESYRLGWVREAVEQGSAWCEAQRGFGDWRRSLDIISGQESQRDLLAYRSQLSGHRLKTNIRTMISGLSNIRPLWGYNAAEAFASYALAMNKTTRALFLEGHWDQSIKEALAYAAATCTGWIRPVWRRDLQGRGTIELLTYGQPCVLPVQLPANGDYQRAYAVTLLDETPIYEAHWRFPDFQDELTPTECKYWYASAVRQAAENNAWKRMTSWFRRRQEDRLTNQYVGIRWTTINDCAINDTGHRMAMGEPGTSWYYEVPYVGEDLAYGRKATMQDARLYPQRRLMISTDKKFMYDGPAFNWHGQLDLVPFCLDKWPWEPMGFSLVRDAWDLQRSIDQIDRGCMDKVNALQDLPLGYNINGVTRGEADSFDPMEPKTRVGYDGDAVDEPFKPAVPAEVYKIHPETLAMRQIYQDELDYTFQTRDIVELSKARALGKGMDQLEALISAQGPIVKDQSRSMEASLGMVGTQVGWLTLQYMDNSRMMQYVGAEGLSLQVFDYDPTKIIPSHLPGEAVHDENQVQVPSKYTPVERAKWFAKNVRCWIMPHTAHEMSQMTNRLLLLQLRQRGFPISAATCMTSCDVPNVSIPDGNSEQEKFWAEKEDEITHAARIQKIVQELGLQQGLMGGAPGTKPNGSTHKGGRPPSGQAAPQLAQKGDGRPLIKES
jgi:hypothetical protein